MSAAIANAIQDASELRLRDLPLTRERLLAAMGCDGLTPTSRTGRKNGMTIGPMR